MAWEPDRMSNFFFSPPAHLCTVTYMTEISLIVTLNNQFNSTTQLYQVCVFRVGRKKKMAALASVGWYIFDFSETNERNSTNLTGSKFSTSSTKFVCFWGWLENKMAAPVSDWPPVRARGLSRECVPPYPQRDRKRRLNGAVCRNHRIKRLVPCRC